MPTSRPLSAAFRLIAVPCLLGAALIGASRDLHDASATLGMDLLYAGYGLCVLGGIIVAFGISRRADFDTLKIRFLFGLSAMSGLVIGESIALLAHAGPVWLARTLFAAAVVALPAAVSAEWRRRHPSPPEARTMQSSSNGSARVIK